MDCGVKCTESGLKCVAAADGDADALQKCASEGKACASDCFNGGGTATGGFSLKCLSNCGSTTTTCMQTAGGDFQKMASCAKDGAVCSSSCTGAAAGTAPTAFPTAAAGSPTTAGTAPTTAGTVPTTAGTAPTTAKTDASGVSNVVPTFAAIGLVAVFAI